MPTRALVLMRALAVISVLEAVGGLFPLVMAVRAAVGPSQALIAASLPGWKGALYTITPISLLLALLLFSSAALLWRLKTVGLALLAWTLASEVLIFLFLTFRAGASVARAGPSPLPEAATAGFYGLIGLGVHMVTAFPLVGGVLVFLAYHWLRAPQVSAATNP